MTKTLEQVVAEHPFPGFQEWWGMGDVFIQFMSKAIGREWRILPGNTGDLEPVQRYFTQYIQTVFGKEASISLVDDFLTQNVANTIQSGEFDALSYAFYRDAFECLAKNIDRYDMPIERARRLFTKKVGKQFFDQVADHLKLNLPEQLDTTADFQQLQTAIDTTGRFLDEQGYLRDNFDFTFTVHTQYQEQQIEQDEGDFLTKLQNDGLAYALYEMGYPVILPSAVYLFHTMGEAQHHSSRTIEELFDRVGYEARETDDFDPVGYPPDKVVELWEIRTLRTS